MLRSEYPPNLKMPIARMDSSKAAAILELLKEPGNDVCADCGAALATDNAWAVLSYGILVCDDCKLVHIEHENHYAASEPNSSTTDISLKGILSTQIPQLWEDKDIAQIRANGNKRTNIRLLANSPVWQYRPSGNDGIKLKEYWIKCKYSGNAGDAAENPKIAAKKQFIGIQFIRPNPKGNYPCCVVLQNDTLYLTSDIRNEEVPVECVETIVVNSKRIGHENGVQLTYRINNDGNTVAFTYLQHENMETVMDWVSLVLYTKYNLLKRKYPTMIDVNVAKILNCGMVKESYIHVSGRGLIYLSLSEARLSCFQHHLEDKPLFQIAVSEVMNLTATQYLDAVACFFDIDASKIQSYADWVAVLEQVLKTDKISAMPDDVPKPSFPFSLLKKQTEKPPPAPAPVPERNNPTPPTNQNHVVKVAPIPTPATTAPPVTTPQQHAPTTQITNGDKEGDKKPNNYECYPPIGPMGEMGKVFRGELPPEAIKPPPSKNDIARLGVFGDYVPGQALPNVAQLQPIKADGFGDLTNPALSSYPTSLNSAVANGIINQGLTKDSTCYPPIGGPAQAMKLRYAEISAAVQMAREQELEEMRNGSLMFRSTTLAQKHAMFDQTRLQSNPAFARGFSESDASTFTQAAMPPPNFQGWGDSGTDNLLTMPWKQTVNGFEATRGFNSSSYPERLAWQKLQAATMERKLSGQENKNLASFGTWGARPQSNEQASASISHVPNAWGTSINAGGMSHWGSKSPTNPLDSFALGRDGRAAPPGITREFSNPGSVTRGFINPKLPSRSDSTSTSPPGVSSQQQMIIENLLRMWKSAEQRLLSLIHNGYVPASDMSPAGLDKDSAEHAYTCVSELFELLWKQRYDLALSFLRGFREVFANSVHPEIRNLFIGVGELDTMKQIFLQQGKEKFLSGSSGGPVTWKQPTPPPSQIEHSWPATTPSLPTVPARESPTDFLPWSPFSPTTDAASLWSGASTSGVTSMRTPSLSSDPWSTSNSIFSSTTSTSVTGPSFNRAPSRPVTHARSSFGDNSPTDGSFGSKASSNSTSPRVVTPPTGFEPSMNSTSLAGIESTLKYIFLNSND